MKKLMIATLVAALVVPAMAAPQLYVDAAPNVSGSPDYAPWWDATKASVVDGTFTNMQTGSYPGTLTMHPVDEIVYSWGTGGKRLHWIYWMDDTTLTSLEGNFEVKFVVDWGGANYTLDWSTNGWLADAPESGWIQPGSWTEYEDGVIGTFGHAWWAGLGVTDPDEQQEAFDNLVSSIFQAQTFATGMIRYRDDANSDWQYSSLTVQVIPAPGAILLAGIGTSFVGWLRRRRAL